jgi:DNA gyrase subunit B
MAVLHDGSGATLTGEALSKHVHDYYAAEHMMQRYAKRYPREFLAALMNTTPITEATLTDQTAMKALCEAWQSAMNRDTTINAFYQIDLKEDLERHCWLPDVSMFSHGIKTNTLINKDFFIHADYRHLSEVGVRLNAAIKAGAYIERDGKKQPVTRFSQAVVWLMAEAKKGQSIQRYKGLGEMNPDQLWETTMDPSVRRMLKVTIEDAIGADQIFNTLMGDAVEPRRDFIESNALAVSNLDF